MKTRITDLLGCQYPVIQGGMAWVAEYHLAAAVSEAGGIGLIGAASAPPEVVREQIRKTKELTDKPFGVNVMLLNPNAPEVAKVVVEEGVKIVTTGAGNPGKFMEMWKQAGVTVIPVVASVAMAKMMERAGADAVVAEGMESGGHIGSQTTMTLVPQVVDAVTIPVIAAGGIADGRGMAAAMMLGAEGVQMGTRFVVAKESIVHQNYKERIIKAKDIDSLFLHIHRQNSGRLRSVHHQKQISALCNLPDFFQIRNISGEIGRMRNYDSFRIFLHKIRKFFILQHTIPVRRKKADFHAFFLQPVKRSEHRIMFADCGYHMISFMKQSENRGIQCFCSVQGKCNLRTILCMKKFCQLLSYPINTPSRLQRSLMCSPSRISHRMKGTDHSRFHLFWLLQRCRRVIQINHGLMIRSAFVIRSAISYILVTSPTCNFPDNP